MTTARHARDLPVLIGSDNYRVWLAQINGYLQLKGVYIYVYGNIKPPVPGKDQENDPEFERRSIEYQVKVDQALGIIKRYIDPTLLPLIADIEHPKRALEKLAKQLEPSGLSLFFSTSAKLFTTKQQPGQTLSQYFAEIDDLVSIAFPEPTFEVSWAGATADQKNAATQAARKALKAETNKWIAAINLFGIHSDYNTVKEIIISSDKVELDTIRARLRHRETELRSSTPSASATEALHLAQAKGKKKFKPRPDVAQGKNHHKPQGKRPSKDSTGLASSSNKCSYCHRAGHTWEQCNRRKNLLERATVAHEKDDNSDMNTSSDDDDVEHAKMHTDTTFHPMEWILDSGATSHMTSNRSWFQDYEEIQCQIVIGNGKSINAIGQGSIMIVINGLNGQVEMTLFDVLHVPAIKNNLLSTAKLAKCHYRTVIDATGCLVTDQISGADIFRPEQRGNMLCVKAEIQHNEDVTDFNDKCFEQANTVRELPLSLNLLHRRLGHPSEKRLRKLLKFLNIRVKNEHVSQCSTCIQAKQTRATLGNGPVERATTTMHMVHSDVCGPMQTLSKAGYKYFVSFIDDFSRYAVVYAITRKSEVVDCLTKFFNMSQHHGKCRILRSDQGGEYESAKLKELLNSRGVAHSTTPTETPELNGVAERFNRTIMTMVRSFLIESGLDDSHWVEALRTAIFINNRLPSTANKGETPCKRWTGKEGRIYHVRTFGCRAFVLKHGYKNKLAPRSSPGIYVGPASEHLGHHRIKMDSTDQIVSTRDAIFIEGLFPAKETAHALPSVKQCWQPKTKKAPSPLLATLSDDDDDDDVPELEPYIKPPRQRYTLNRIFTDEDLGPVTPLEDVGSLTDDDDTMEGATNQASASGHFNSESEHPTMTGNSSTSGSRGESGDNPETSALRRSERTKKPNVRLQGYATIAQDKGKVPTSAAAKTITPNSFKEATSTPQAELWKKAMVEEIKAIRANGTYVLVPLPHGRNPIQTRWVYKIKFLADGSIDRYKARWVAKGFTQRFGVDYDETFAPVVRLENLRFLLAMANAMNLDIHQLDVNSAFLLAELDDDEVIYITQPEGFVDPKHPNWVCRLIKSLYGLKQAPRKWHTTISHHLFKNGFKPTDADECVYVKTFGQQIVFIALYVDDLTIIAHPAIMKQIKGIIASTFPTKDLGEAKSVLGIEIHCDRKHGKLYILQRGKVDEILERFGMTECHPLTTPMTGNLKLTTAPTSDPNIPYRQAIGMLSYLAHATRPDIMYAVNYLSRFTHGYGQEHWKAVKRIIRYLASTKDLAITYDRALFDLKDPSTQIPIGYCDADWGNNEEDSRSITGIIFTFCGGPISWASKTQKCIALSSNEAELNALSEGARQALYIRKLCAGIGSPINLPLTLYNDNQGALHIATGVTGIYHGRMKHYTIKVNHLRDTATKKLISLGYCPTQDMVADLLTKALGRVKLHYLKGRLNMQALTTD